MKTSDQVNEISKALSNAQGQMTPAKKTANNPFFRSKYSDFASVWASIRTPMEKNELAILQDVSMTQTGIAVSTRLIHSSGQWIEFGPLEISLTKRDSHAVGSAISYAKRYALSAAVGVVSEDEDDDGNTASHEAPVEQKKQQESVQVIDAGQVKNLESLVLGCGPDFMVKIMQPKLEGYKLKAFAEIPQRMYKNVESFLIKARDEFMSQSENINDINNI